MNGVLTNSVMVANSETESESILKCASSEKNRAKKPQKQKKNKNKQTTNKQNNKEQTTNKKNKKQTNQKQINKKVKRCLLNTKILVYLICRPLEIVWI